MYRLYNYDQMIISTSLLSFFSSLLSLLPLFEYAQGRLAPPKGVHVKLSTSMSSKPKCRRLSQISKKLTLQLHSFFTFNTHDSLCS